MTVIRNIVQRLFFKFRSSSSLLIIALLSLVFVYKLIEYKPWDKNRTLAMDVSIYYAYLPAACIYNDFDFKYSDQVVEEEPGTQIWYSMSPIDKPVLKMTCGMAIMYSPFFLMAHCTALITGSKANGYSTIYSFFICLGALVYIIASMVILRLILLRYFSELAVVLCLIILFLGSNIYYYTIYEGGMSHIYSLFLLSLLILLCIKWIEKEQGKFVIYIGIVLGLMTLVRPTNGVFSLLVPLIGIDSFKALRSRFQLIIKQWKFVTLGVLVGLALIFIQLLYWKSQTGSWYYSSYGEETFYFLDPHIFEGLFSYRKGYYLYSPLMFISFLGLLFLWLKAPEFWLAITVLFPLFIWICFSWWCWWYGGSFGNRSMIEISALMSIPLAAFIETLAIHNRIVRRGFYALIAIFVFLNIFQTYQYVVSIIYTDSMTKEAYWHAFLKKKITDPHYYEKLQQPDNSNAVLGKPEYQNWPKLNEKTPQSNVVIIQSEHDLIVVEGQSYGNTYTKANNLHLVLDTDADFSNGTICDTILTIDNLPINELNDFMIHFKDISESEIYAYLYYEGMGNAYCRLKEDSR